MDDYSNYFARVVTSINDLRENLYEYGAISKLVRLLSKEFDALILLLE